MDPGAQTAVRRVRAGRGGRPPLERALEFARRDLGPALIGSALPFALVLYLSLRGGGYDRVVYSEVGIAVWWLLLLGALVGVLPAARISRAGWAALALLFAFAVWTALGITWSESAERSAAEAGRVAAYLGVFALALAAQGRDGLRRTVNAVAAAVALVGVLALLSRLHPSWFPEDNAARLLPVTGNRLNYPLNYWNGLAALMAMGIPLVLVVALRARHLVTRALAAAALPALALTAFYTFSRGGAVAIGVALIVFLVLYPRRVATLPTLLVSGAGTALLIASATQRDALENHAIADAARTQGDQMLAIVLVVCAGVGLLQVAIGLAARHGLGPRPRVSPRGRAALAAGAVAAAVVIALAAGLPGELADRWADTNTSAGRRATGAERLQSVNTETRQEYWDSALDANATAPLIGIGPGTFQYWWARNGGAIFIRNAHSLFLETLAELGIIGLTLVVSVAAFLLGTGIRRALRAGPDVRAALAAAVASCVAFTSAAALDWIWQLPVLPVAFLLLAAAILGRMPAPSGEAIAADEAPRQGRLRERIGLVALAIPAVIAIAIPLASTELVRRSQSQLRSGERESALRSAETAGAVEPFAASASTQQALVLERSGDLGRAVGAAREATHREPTNSRTWLLVAQLEAERGRATEAIAAYNRGYQLSPRSAVFVNTLPEEFASQVRESSRAVK